MSASRHIRALSIADRIALTVAIILGTAGFVFARFKQSAPPPHGTVLRIHVHGKSLEGNLEGDTADPFVSIYLPPSYNKDRQRRYPVLYLLHGYMDEDSNWFGEKHVFVDAPATIDKALANGSREMIIVMPDAHTAYLGSMYSSSPVTGDWETFITHDLRIYGHALPDDSKSHEPRACRALNGRLWDDSAGNEISGSFLQHIRP